MQTPNADAVLLAKKDANTLYQTAIHYDGKGGRQVLSYGLMSIQPAYATTLYQNAYWTGTVCRLPLNTATIGMPTIPYVRSDGFPSFDSTSAAGCPTGWISFNVSRHRSSDLLWEQQTADAANLNYHYQLSSGNWDFQFISSIANATKDSITNTYPNTCPTSGISSLSYMGHLTMSKDGFTAAGNACEGGVPYYQFINGKFFTPTAYQISGTLSGLNSGASVTLTNNGGDQITLSANGVFTFPTSIGASSPYLVAVKTQPTGQTCTVGNSSGTGAAHAQNISVTCTPTSMVYSLSESFSVSKNPNGPWRYGETAGWGGTFTLFKSILTDSNSFGTNTGWVGLNAFANTPSVLKWTCSTNCSLRSPNNSVIFHPSFSSRFTTIRFEIPIKGTYLISAGLWGADPSIGKNGGTNVGMLVNGQLFGAKIKIDRPDLLASSPKTINATMKLNYGDLIDFTIDYDGQMVSDSTGIALTITATNP